MNNIFISLLAFAFIITANSISASDQSWEQVHSAKQGEISIHYRINEPFLIDEGVNSLKGLEYEMMIGFKYFLLNKYGIKLEMNWYERKNFRDIFNYIKEDSKPGDIGLDIVSRTPEREGMIGFSEPYFPDIQVIISQRSVSTATNIDEFLAVINNLAAISVKGTTYDQNLKRIKEDFELDFEIKYIDNSNQIIETILQSEEYFGYTDLPSYLIALDQNKPVIRHNVFPVNGIGFCIIFNLNSDWKEPLNEYLKSSEFKLLQNKSIQKYLGYDVNNLISSISAGESEEIVLLKQEKKSINKHLSEKAKEVEQQAFIRNILIITIVLALMVAYFLFNRNRVKTTANEVLTLHRKMIESQNKLLSKRNEELIEANLEKNNFIQILSHDLRSPINNITGLSKILLMDSEEKLSSEQEKIINHIATESRRLNKMVTRILDIEKIESKTSDEFHEIDLKEGLERVIENYYAQATAKDIKLENNLQPDVYILGLDQFVFHVFENLVSNGIKFSHRGKSVTITSKVIDEWVEVQIKDEGPGMTEEDMKNMFKKFQVLSAKATGGERSTGLGLSIVNKYVKLLNGELECSSEIGKGTIFKVKLKTVKKGSSENS
ncbi:MAG: transporter substrate-binding domain-containing protein [Reichenbachiella sp.]